MDLPINKSKPLVMHIDLNSCFATIEQQANPLLRGKPIVVAAYQTPNACILAPSIEAKRFGIKTGMRIHEARPLCPNLIVRTPDPPKYRDVHQKFMKIFTTYSPKVLAKSIDEAVIYFTLTHSLHPDLVFIARQIKNRMKKEIGEWIVCSIGISTNKCLAKLAATIRKPDGLLVIDHTNLLAIYKEIDLMDFCGINVRYKSRLNVHGIFTPIDFFNSTCQTLQKQVFKSIGGRYWYEKLRGWEMDIDEFETKTIGHQYALKKATNDEREISRLMMKLCEKMGRKLRKEGFSAEGIHVALTYKDWTYWHKGKKFKSSFFTTTELFKCAQLILNEQPEKKLVSKISVNAFSLTKNQNCQIDLFEGDFTKKRKAAKALDDINNKYGEFTITPALMMNMSDTILDRIAFSRSI